MIDIPEIFLDWKYFEVISLADLFEFPADAIDEGLFSVSVRLTVCNSDCPHDFFVISVEGIPLHVDTREVLHVLKPTRILFHRGKFEEIAVGGAVQRQYEQAHGAVDRHVQT